MEHKTFYDEVSLELGHIYDFWKKLKDSENGGFYGFMSYGRELERNAPKGVILNSRILWFFSNVCTLTKNNEALGLARHAYEYMKKSCIDYEYGGVFWMTDNAGNTLDDMKHTYNQAFAIYGLSSYYEASGDDDALELAYSLFSLIEEKCADEYGYAEAFDRKWNAISNEKLSEDGFDADKTMNTLLHVIEAYTELYRVDKSDEVADALGKALDITYNKVYNKNTHILGVYFNEQMKPIADVYSYGHDIEASWLIDRALDVLGAKKSEIRNMNREIAEKVYESAYHDGVIYNQSIGQTVDKKRIWWIQAESVVGFLNAYKHTGKEKYLETSVKIWETIRETFIDKRDNSEWFYELDEGGKPNGERELVGPWKCPYHNGRMCMEVMKRYERI